MKKKKSLDNYFLLTWKKAWIMVVAGFVSILLHNATDAIFNIEEPVFFSIVIFVIPTYFVVCLVYTLIKRFKSK
jgi:hypothetical protein